MFSGKFSGPVWSLFRIMVGFLFACHGAATVLGLFGGHRGSGEAVALGSWPNWWAGLIQLACGVLVLLGLVTRPAAVLCSGSMAYAYFITHQPNSLLPINNGGVSAALYAWSFLAIAALGAGPWSIDARLRPRHTAAGRATPELSVRTRPQPDGT
ncbi:DoxX family protein [Solwaraspora sp. WMMB335]|uniref:DoxX family protein n=1 Tax=Solwaraspora sp. WMMB335 TaxID=3404118 RepID=UPI003B940459